MHLSSPGTGNAVMSAFTGLVGKCNIAAISLTTNATSQRLEGEERINLLEFALNCFWVTMLNLNQIQFFGIAIKKLIHSLNPIMVNL